jgi:hypothetical protein
MEPDIEPASLGRTARSVQLQTLKDAAAAGETAVLIGIRDKIASEIDSGTVPAHALAGLLRLLREVTHQIDMVELRDLEKGPSGPEPWDPSLI